MALPAASQEIEPVPRIDAVQRHGVFFNYRTRRVGHTFLEQASCRLRYLPQANIWRVTGHMHRNIKLPGTAVVNVLVASLHADCFSSSGCMRSGLSQTSSFNFQLRVDRDQRRGLRCLASA
jgi:hypothetical protein